MSTGGLDIEDHAALAAYLAVHQPAAKPIGMQTLAGGVSNRTVLVDFADGTGWVLKQALAKLRTKADWFSDPARVHREALGIRWLGKLAPPGTIPGFVFEDVDEHLLAMEAVAQPHENWKTMLLAGQVEQDHVHQFATLLGQIHERSSRQADELTNVFGDTTFFESLRLEPYYLYTAQQVPEASSFLHSLVEQTRLRRTALVHGDYSPKNILVHRGRLILLDHEVIHWGDPAFDLGFALAHFISKARHLHQYSAQFAQAAGQFFAEYISARGWKGASSEFELQVIHHACACTLARVAGRSPLEYLADGERTAQRDAVLNCLAKQPYSFSQFLKLILE